VVVVDDADKLRLADAGPTMDENSKRILTGLLRLTLGEFIALNKEQIVQETTKEELFSLLEFGGKFDNTLAFLDGILELAKERELVNAMRLRVGKKRS